MYVYINPQFKQYPGRFVRKVPSDITCCSNGLSKFNRIPGQLCLWGYLQKMLVPFYQIVLGDSWYSGPMGPKLWPMCAFETSIRCISLHSLQMCNCSVCFGLDMCIYIWYIMILSADPCRQQGERVRGGLTSNKGRKEKIRRRGPQALLFGCGGDAVLGQTAS